VRCGTLLSGVSGLGAYRSSYAAPKKKKRKWPGILAAILILFFLARFFLSDGEEPPDYGNAFAPENAQGYGAADKPEFSGTAPPGFDEAIDAILNGK
jgi:hypothetical protein